MRNPKKILAKKKQNLSEGHFSNVYEHTKTLNTEATPPFTLV